MEFILVLKIEYVSIVGKKEIEKSEFVDKYEYKNEKFFVKLWGIIKNKKNIISIQMFNLTVNQ